MKNIPRDPSFDSTYALLFSEGYRFISNRCERLGTDMFETRIMLRRAVCVQGAEAAEQFYYPGRFTRWGAMPLLSLTPIQDNDSVMMLDGEDQRRSKRMFLSFMSPESLARLTRLTSQHWRAHVERWRAMRRVNLLDEAHIPLCAAVCAWAGLPLSETEIRQRALEFEIMVEGIGSIGPRNWRGHLMRFRTERWMRQIVRDIRGGRLRVPESSSAYLISTFRDSRGRLMDVKFASVELINLLRPAVTNARFIVFALMALHANPGWRKKLAKSDDQLGFFVDEVRRFYPFIHIVAGRVLQEFTWRDHHFKKRDWIIMDLYGANHDRRIWGDPERFRPERFQNERHGPYDLVSHGAGDCRVTHRCPGECITVEQMKSIVRIMVREVKYDVSRQDLTIDLSRIPAVPNGGFFISNVAWHAHVKREKTPAAA